jgi:hypothetical protein
MALGLHFKPVMLTVSLPGAAYCTKGVRTAGTLNSDCDGIVTMGDDLSRISAGVPNPLKPIRQRPKKTQNNSDGD